MLAITVIVIFLAWLFSHYFAFVNGLAPDGKKLDDIRVKVLYHTDHEELLKICRKKLAEYNNTHSDSDKPYWMTRYIPTASDGELYEFNAYPIRIGKNYIEIEMYKSISYEVYLNVFPEGAKGFGDMEIIEGLWYHDEGFRNLPQYSEYLKSLQ